MFLDSIMRDSTRGLIARLGKVHSHFANRTSRFLPQTEKMNAKPNQFASTTSRHCSRDSFGGVYSDKENEIFLQLAKSVFEEEDDDSVWVHEDNQSRERRRNVKEGECPCGASLNPTRGVTFGCASVYEFWSDEAPILADVYKYHNELLRPTMQPHAQKTKITFPKQQERIQLSKQQSSQLQIPKLASKTSRDSSLDREPRLPKRSFDETQAAQRVCIS